MYCIFPRMFGYEDLIAEYYIIYFYIKFQCVYIYIFMYIGACMYNNDKNIWLYVQMMGMEAMDIVKPLPAWQTATQRIVDGKSIWIAHAYYITFFKIDYAFA